MPSPGRLTAHFYVSGEVFFFGAAWSRSRPGRVVGIVEPATFGIQQMRRLVDGKQSVPIGLRIAAIDRLRKVEFRVAPGNKIALKVGDVTVSIGKDRVV